MSNSPLATVTQLSPNRNSPRNHKIDRITIHCFVGQVTAKRGCEVFLPASKARRSQRSRRCFEGYSQHRCDRRNRRGKEKPWGYFATPSFEGGSILGRTLLAKGVSDSRTPILRNGALGTDKKAFAERVATE